MRRAITLSLPVVIAAVLALGTAPAGAGPAITARGSSRVASTTDVRASQYTYTFTVRQCFSNQVRFRVRQDEFGRSGTNYFQQKAHGEVFFNGSWHVDTGTTSAARSGQFADDSRHFFWAGTTIFYNHAVDGLHHRVIDQLLWRNNAGSPGFFGDDFNVASARVFLAC